MEERPWCKSGSNSWRAACSASIGAAPDGDAAVSPYSVSMPKTLRLTSLAALLDETLHEGFGVRLEDGVDLVKE